MASQLLKEEIRSEMLIPQLEQSKVPPKWRALMLRLLEPQSVNRITAFQLVQEFPDLIEPQYVVNDNAASTASSESTSTSPP